MTQTKACQLKYELKVKMFARVDTKGEYLEQLMGLFLKYSSYGICSIGRSSHPKCPVTFPYRYSSLLGPRNCITMCLSCPWGRSFVSKFYMLSVRFCFQTVLSNMPASSSPQHLELSSYSICYFSLYTSQQDYTLSLRI